MNKKEQYFRKLFPKFWNEKKNYILMYLFSNMWYWSRLLFLKKKNLFLFFEQIQTFLSTFEFDTLPHSFSTFSPS